jgi:Na+/proline symporter
VSLTQSAAPARSQTAARPISLSLTGFWFLGALVFGIAGIYFLGVDQGSVSVTGDGLLLHELFHDARHSLGFPCH